MPYKHILHSLFNWSKTTHNAFVTCCFRRWRGRLLACWACWAFLRLPPGLQCLLEAEGGVGLIVFPVHEGVTIGGRFFFFVVIVIVIIIVVFFLWGRDVLKGTDRWYETYFSYTLVLFETTWEACMVDGVVVCYCGRMTRVNSHPTHLWW